jgi:hypothetical protein
MRLLFTNLRIDRAGRAERVDADRPVADDPFGRGLDMALTLLVFTGLGWLLDSRLGLFPVFTIAFLVLAAVGVFTKVKYAYDTRMATLEAERRAGAASRRSTTEPATEHGRLEDVG